MTSDPSLEGPLQVHLEVPLSKTFTVKSPEEQSQYFTIVDQYRFQYATGFSGSAVLSSNGSMELEHCLEEFEVGYYCAEEADTQRLSGKNGHAVKIDYTDGLLSAAGEMEQYTVTKTDASGVRHTTVHTSEAVVEEASSSLIPEPEESSLSE